MMRFTPRPEPAKWNDRCRERGRRWLSKNPEYDRPQDYWTEFESDLRREFQGLCAYCVMLVMKGEMDHLVPLARLKKDGQDALAYEWSNFRYSEGVLNQRKSDHLVLDPFEVSDDWFELILPSLQLRLTQKVPHALRKQAEFTLERLGLQDDEVIVRYRRQWYEMYLQGKLTLEGLREVAPLIARAVEAMTPKKRDDACPD